MIKFVILEVFSSYRYIVWLLNMEVRKYRLVIIVVVYSVLCGMLLCDSLVKMCGVLLLYVRVYSIWVDVYILELFVDSIVVRIIVFIIVVVESRFVCWNIRVNGLMLMFLILLCSRFGLVYGIIRLIIRIVNI